MDSISRFSEVVRDITIPVYGLCGGPLQPVSFEYGRDSDRRLNIAMRYVPPKVPGAEIAAFLETRNRPSRDEPGSELWELVLFGETLLFYAGHPSQRHQQGSEIMSLDGAYGEGKALTRELSVPDFRKTIAKRWMVPEILTVMMAENDENQLLIGALGFEDQEFVRLLPTVRRIDNDTELLAWHDEVFARRLREILDG